MTHPGTCMAREIAEAPAVVAAQEDAPKNALHQLARRLRTSPPRVVVTCARGSSAHAAVFAKHILERYLGVPVSPAAPSIASVYRRVLDLEDQLVLAISQSGRSDDLLAFTECAKRAGALTVAITNEAASPLAHICDVVLPIGAGPEHSVAATKTFVGTAAALLRLAAAWAGDDSISNALQDLPGRLVEAGALDWSEGALFLSGAASMVAIGRGPTLSIAREAALKLKEVCNLHAEAFSGAEFLHGPVALVRESYPALMFVPIDEAALGMRLLATDLAQKGTAMLVAGRSCPGIELPTLQPRQPEADAICMIQSFYVMAVSIAARMGIDVDQPRHLHKVTRTT